MCYKALCTALEADRAKRSTVQNLRLTPRTTKSSSCPVRLDLLVGVSRLVVLAQIDLLAPLRDGMLDEQFLGVLARELSDESRVPQLAGYTEILTAPGHGVGLAAFDGGRDALGVEVVLFATGD